MVTDYRRRQNPRSSRTKGLLSSSSLRGSKEGRLVFILRPTGFFQHPWTNLRLFVPPALMLSVAHSAGKLLLTRSTLLDVLTSQTELDQARRDLIRARYDRRVARAQLEALVGREL